MEKDAMALERPLSSTNRVVKLSTSMFVGGRVTKRLAVAGLSAREHSPFLQCAPIMFVLPQP